MRAIWPFRRGADERRALSERLHGVEQALRELREAVLRGEDERPRREEVQALGAKVDALQQGIDAVQEAVARLARQAYTRATQERGALDDLRRLEAAWREFAASWRKDREDEGREREALLRALLPLKDAFGAARRLVRGDESARLLLDPLEERLDLVLRGLGAEETARAREPFRPSEQVVVHVVAHPEPAGTILAVLRQGYRLGGRLVRPAEVLVSRGPAPPPPEGDGGEPLPAAVDGEAGGGSDPGEAADGAPETAGEGFSA